MKLIETYKFKQYPHIWLTHVGIEFTLETKLKKEQFINKSIWDRDINNGYLKRITNETIKS